MLYIKNPKGTTRKLLELINEYSKVSGYKTNTQNPLHSFTLTIRKQKEKLRETDIFTIVIKIIKYLGINLPKETRSIYRKL